MYQRPAVTQRISYVLRKDENRNAHLLGVNALALDTTTPTTPIQPSSLTTNIVTAKERRRHSSRHYVPGGILYTGGRDGMIAAWDLHFESPIPRDIPGETPEQPKGLPPSTFRQSFNHHTDWVNDIVLCHNGETLVSASSDRTVKLVRPHSHNPTAAHIIGTHGDYVKTLAYASGPGWVASGGLDKTVNIWDIKESRSTQFISLGAIPETSSKASIYALACNPIGTVLATGSPEKIIRVWDPRSGQRITKFAGHTDNIRALLISESGDTILSASSDTTIKLWSLTAQRCITTFTMHSDSVWSLYSDHPQLATFYGGGKDGIVTKTEINRYNPQHHSDFEDEDPGQCVVICKAETGVARLVAHDNARIWTATSSSSVFQWPDIPTRANRAPEMIASIVPANLLKMNLNESTFTDLIPEHYYPTSTVYSAASLGSLFVSHRDKQSQHSSEDDEGLIAPIFEDPENVIEGEHGLIKHTLLNNRRMVVTEDKCGEVALWDIIKCIQLDTFPGRKLDDVVNELNTIESVPTWCTIDTRIGALTVHLDEGRCFDAEVYVDEIEEIPDPERPEDQRIVIGKWVLKNLFDNYVPVHIEAYEKETYRIQHPNDSATQLSVSTTALNEKGVESGGYDTKKSDLPAVASDGSRPPVINTTPEALKEPLASSELPTISSDNSKANNSSPHQDSLATVAGSSPSSSREGSVSVAPTTGTTAAAAATASTNVAPTSSGGKLSALGSHTASSSVPSTPLSISSTTSTAASSSNGFMGRLKHSVKKLTRTPSSEQKFENGRSMSSKKSVGTIAIPMSGGVSKAPNSPSIPEHPSPFPAITTSATASTSASGAGVGTGTSTSTASSPRTTVIDGTPTPGGSAGLGGTKVNEDDQATSDTTSSHSIESIPSPVQQLPNPAISMRPPHPPFTPLTHLDCPTVPIPAHIPVIISEQSREASSSVDLYRGTVGSLGYDYVPLVQVIPTWLLEVLLKNMIPVKETPKVSFVLRPHHEQDITLSLPGSGRLGELPGGNPRLTAPRMLRVRKVVAHVVDKLALTPPKRASISVSISDPASRAVVVDAAFQRGHTQTNQPPLPPRSIEAAETSARGPAIVGSADQPPPPGNKSQSVGPSVSIVTKTGEQEEEEEEFWRQEALRPENWLEILCNDQVLSPTMTLATVRTHYWKTGSDVVLTYRYKQQNMAIVSTLTTTPSLLPSSAT
ncbi:hypothetical protein BX616_005440 [Lobosporangium transversale]|uniref:Uncharacterized protein n=1 Tax=Lobosporangium transversale TaxID=64571 RepID=A0A1Y2GPU0_9FUNG|nr:hypothetical protein BCR41DRAFT_353656 [Lobosporangium transversale]KAF9915766.1 hypothetical protein BX616_005440 [Lobosporangium transversale]ORZ16192.1 hypothetical protein BCR41DRAFT_353656 [Lobosporangium transversale]|eukprot:XP_021881539.1 hypothetical protein BCR41DRAFT_353656 [Lobosporangium transversale]